MRNIWKRLVPLMLAVVMVLGVTPNTNGVEEHLCRYEYVLYATQDGVSDGTAKLELYILAERSDGLTGEPDEAPGPLLDAGAFGLRFPEWLDGFVRFQPAEYVTLQQIVPEQRYPYPPNEVEVKGKGYHAFNWFGRMSDGPQGTIPKGQGWSHSIQIGGYCMKLGVYTLDLKGASAPEEGSGATWTLPYKSDVGQLEWLTVKEAVAVEVGDTEADGGDALNRTLWNPETKLYQGYYEDPDADTEEGAPPVQTDIGFRFDPPKPWPSANASLTLVTYDPKKDVEIALYAWDEEAQGYKTDAAYTLTVPGESSGTDVCKQTIGFHEAVFKAASGNDIPGTDLPSGKYQMVIRKQSHVGAYLMGVTVSRDGTETKLFPQLDGRTLTLPCGDVTGDGKIRQGDRAQLMQPGRYMKSVDEKNLYDLNGDRRVDQKDLAILTAPENYGKNNFSIGFTETTNVGETVYEK